MLLLGHISCRLCNFKQVQSQYCKKIPLLIIIGRLINSLVNLFPLVCSREKMNYLYYETKLISNIVNIDRNIHF